MKRRANDYNTSKFNIPRLVPTKYPWFQKLETENYICFEYNIVKFAAEFWGKEKDKNVNFFFKTFIYIKQQNKIKNTNFFPFFFIKKNFQFLDKYK